MYRYPYSRQLYIALISQAFSKFICGIIRFIKDWHMLHFSSFHSSMQWFTKDKCLSVLLVSHEESDKENSIDIYLSKMDGDFTEYENCTFQ